MRDLPDKTYVAYYAHLYKTLIDRAIDLIKLAPAHNRPDGVNWADLRCSEVEFVVSPSGFWTWYFLATVEEANNNELVERIREEVFPRLNHQEREMLIIRTEW